MSLETDAVNAEDEDFVDELKPGTKLMLGQYTIEDFLAAGGFGITYLAKDSLDRRVVIKECFPGSFCRRQNTSVTPRSRAHQNELKSIVRLFSQEAMSLAKANHPNIVGVHQVFEENNTAYMALDYVQGRDLLEILQDDPDSLKPDLVEGYLTKILDAIKHIHKLGMLHRDISPDNIIINEQGEPILIDFGAARESTNERVTRMLSALRVVKDGYSPQEFYIAGSEQSPSCDLYSLAASFYHLITRELPPDSQWRLSACAAGDEDPYVSLGEKTNDYPKHFVSALDKAMSILPRDRMQDAEEWLAHMSDGATATATKAPQNMAPAAANSNKKSFMPVLLGTTAVAAAAGAGFFLMSNSDSGAPTETLGVGEVASATETSTGASTPTEALASNAQPVDTAEASQPENTLPFEVNTFAPPADDAVAEVAEDNTASISEAPDLPTIGEIAVEIGEPPLPAVEETTDFVVPPIILALPEQMAVPQPRPFRDAEQTIASIGAELPVIDTTAPAAPPEAKVPVESQEPTEVVEADDPAETAVEDDRPAQQIASNEATESTLDFFMSMSTSEPDLVSVRSSTASSAAVTEEPRPTLSQPVSNEPAVPTIVTRFVPALPFSLSPWSPGVVISVGENAPSWLTQSARIVSVNGQPVASNEEITAAFEELVPQDDALTFDVTIGVDAGLNTAVTERTLTVGKEQHTLLLNGLSFVSRQIDSGWITEVAAVPGASNFQVGDTLVSYVSTWEDITGPDTLETILNRELANGTNSFSFAVSRGGEIWIEAFNLAALN